MPIDLKGAKKIGFKWAIWDYGRDEWASVSQTKPSAPQLPSDTVFSIDQAIEMQEKGTKPARRGQAPAAKSPYTPQLPAQGPSVAPRDEQSFFSLPGPEQAGQQGYGQPQPMQQPQQYTQPQQRAPLQQPRQAVQRPALPTMRATMAEMVTPAAAGGVAMGVVMGIPILNACLPVWFIGGILGAFLLLTESPVRSTLAPDVAAKIGAFAGLIGAVVSLIVSFIAIVFVGDAIISLAGAQSSEVSMLALNAMGVDNDLDIYFAIFSLVSRIVLFPLFGALGAVLYVKYGSK